MRVIITGGSGLIGRHLSANLIEDGHEVVVLSRSPRKAVNLPKDVVIQGWDARTAENWGDLVNSDTAIVNLAGAGLSDQRWSDDRKEVILNSRIRSGEAVVAAVEAASEKPKVVIQASAVGYYGDTGDKVLTEESEPGDDYLADVCQQWEASTAPVEEMGVRRAIIRTGIVLSKKGGALPRMLTPFRLFVGGPLGSGQQYFPWIHIEDEVRAIQFLIENEKTSGAHNMAAPQELTNAQFSRVLGMVMNRPAVLNVPPFALQAVFGDMSTVLLGGQRIVPQRLLDAGFEFKYTEAEAALRDILNKPKKESEPEPAAAH
jgi:hypothetical protein